jgi:mannose-6-phosphate isomerase-like protein (cupin superfamily)
LATSLLSGIVNLTAAADRLRSDDGPPMQEVVANARLSVAILKPIDGQPFEAGPAPADLFYVVIAGFGCLISTDGDDIDFTAGDILFVEAGSDRRFRNLSRKFQAWRIELLAPPAK